MCTWRALLERLHQQAPAATTSKTTPETIPDSPATPSPAELASVAVPVSGAASGIFGDDTAPTEIPEDASARLRFSAVAAAATPAALSVGTCGATLAVSLPHPLLAALNACGEAATHCREGCES